MNQELTYQTFYIDLLLSVFGFVISHGYRNYILRNQWIQKETEILIRYVLFATGLLAVIYNILYYLLLYLLRIEVLLPDACIVSFITVYVIFALWNLIYFSWQYLEKSRMFQIETLKMESSLKDLEIKTIRSNLQPHFIFNSLNSIRALIDEDPELARAAITKISNILRNTITKQEATDTLQNELALVEDYLDLEKIRFEERLHFIKNIDAATLGVQIPTMMLQTLIENAIKHGISNLEAGGNVLLNSKTDGSYLIIEVINDINTTQVSTRENSLGFGLSSSKQRLKLLYENEASLSLNFDHDQAVVLIKIPLNKNINSANL
jgi:LytS/YehU family sensor histidine kinase